MERTERTDKTERTLSSTPLKPPKFASSAHPDQLDPKDHPDPRDHPDQRDLPESHPRTEFPANKECKASLVQSDVQDAKDHVEPPDSPVVSSPFPAHKDQLDLPDQPENKDQRDNPDPTDSPSKDHPVSPESQERPDARVAPDLPAQPVHPERTERRVLANTAHPHVPLQDTKSAHAEQVGEHLTIHLLRFTDVRDTPSTPPSSRFASIAKLIPLLLLPVTLSDATRPRRC
ncbi:unnamed protein product [Bursaphelenchus xylophilus]|uniref:(pine wood nematode) hypothetical protein n=1 Tax=Bursaphelenchus xylophilus TaxID=6326 RepID=A0A811KRP2_BURXY|nr:unnamed protein product [Bursaphelenchus xylophilus]CAG9101207.1 unnamed protein product [Bursaphelenchus xylophilus]